MSKVRRPRHQRQGGKPLPNLAQLTPAPGHETADGPTGSAAPEPAATEIRDERQDEPVAFAAESGPADAFSLQPDLMPLPVLQQDAGEPEDDASIPAATPSLPPMTPRLSAEAFGSTVMNYFISEGEAIASHWRALAGARSMAEIVRLQIGEFQRAADATLTCWGVLTLAAGRTVAPR